MNELSTPRRFEQPRRAAEYAGVSRTKLYQLIATGRIRAVKLDAKTLVDLTSIDEMFAALPAMKSQITSEPDQAP